MEGYMILDKNMRDGINNIDYKIGEAYKHENNLLVFHFYTHIVDAILSHINTEDNKIVKVLVDSNVELREELSISSNVLLVKEVTKEELLQHQRKMIILMTGDFKSNDIIELKKKVDQYERRFNIMMPTHDDGSLVEVIMNPQAIYNRTE